MAVSVVVAGVSYTIPQVGDVSWAPQVTAWIQAISAVTLQTSGGTFTLTSDLNFGASFGLISLYYKSQSANIAQSGIVRLANGDGIGWRNSGNSADLILKPDADGILQYNGVDLVTLTGAQSPTNKTFDSTSTMTGVKIASLTPDGTHTLTMPTVTDTLVGLAASQALTNKTIAAGSNTITGLTDANLSGSAGIQNANLHTMAANTVKANVTGGVATPTDVAITSAATASAAMIRDANANVSANNFLEGYTTTATAAGTTSLTASSTFTQRFTGTTTQTVKLPDCTTLALGQQFYIINRSTGTVTVQDNAAGAVQTMASNTSILVTCTNIGTAAGAWDVQYVSNTALSNPMTTGGDLIYGGSSGTPARLANGSNGQVLQSTGGTTAPQWATVPGNTTILKTPTVQRFTSTGTTTGYLFNISTSTTCAIGDTYTNNGNTYTVLAALSAQSGAVLFMSGASAPTSSGTLTRSSGSGTASVTFSSNIPLATYTTPTGPTPIALRVRVQAGGGGGGGGGINGGGQTGGGNGANSYFGALLLAVSGGVGGGTVGSPGGAGGNSFTVSSPAITILQTAGGSGSGGSFSGATAGCAGSPGGASYLGGTGGGGPTNGTGLSATANTGGGGGGGGTNASSTYPGAGGGAGGYIEAIIPNPSATYVYAVGNGGTAGNLGTSGAAGGTGATGIIVIEELYQ